MIFEKNYRKNILVFVKNIEDKQLYFEVFFSKDYKSIKRFDWRDVIYLLIKENDNNSVFYPRTIIDGFERKDDRCLFMFPLENRWFSNKKIELSKNIVSDIIQFYM